MHDRERCDAALALCFRRRLTPAYFQIEFTRVERPPVDDRVEIVDLDGSDHRVEHAECIPARGVPIRDVRVVRAHRVGQMRQAARVTPHDDLDDLPEGEHRRARQEGHDVMLAALLRVDQPAEEGEGGQDETGDGHHLDQHVRAAVHGVAHDQDRARRGTQASRYKVHTIRSIGHHQRRRTIRRRAGCERAVDEHAGLIRHVIVAPAEKPSSKIRILLRVVLLRRRCDDRPVTQFRRREE